MCNFQCLNFHPIFVAFDYWMIQALGYFAHSASHTIFHQPITPTLSVHSRVRPDPAGEAFSNLQSSLTPRFMGSLSALSIAHSWSYVSIFTLANINIKTLHFLYYDLLPFSKATRTLAAALPRSWNWLSVFALGPVRCNMPNARDKASFLAGVNGPGRNGLL